MARASRSEGDATGGQIKNKKVKAATVRCPNPQIPSHHTPHSREGSNGVVGYLDTTTAAMGDADTVKAAIDRRIAGANFSGRSRKRHGQEGCPVSPPIDGI